jgi:hypothetical protein
METEFRVNASGAAVSSCDLTNGSSDRGSRLRWGKEGIDDLDKLPSFEAGEAPRRSTSSLAVIRASALYSANQRPEAHLCPEQCPKSNRKFALSLM